MKRRVFLILGTSVSVSSAFFGFFGTKKEDKWLTLQDVQNHIFPQHGSFPSAGQIESVRYLKMVSKDDSFDQTDLDFIFDGVREVQRRGWLSKISDDEKERLLLAFSKTTFGENWLSIVLNYTFEALLSDPLYGGNVHQQGWKSLNHNPGQPRPKSRFGVVA